jgi:hypothetical protein
VLGALLFSLGVLLISVGLIAELLVRIYHESQGKPTYMVRELRPDTSLDPKREHVGIR